MKSQHLKLFFLLMVLLVMVSACKRDRKWNRLELTCNDGWYTGYEFQITADGQCKWYAKNTSSDFKALVMHGTATPELMTFLNESLSKEEFISDTSIVNCCDCGICFLLVKYDQGTDKFNYYECYRPGVSGRVIDRIENFLDSVEWRDSTDEEINEELMKRILSR